MCWVDIDLGWSLQDCVCSNQKRVSAACVRARRLKVDVDTRWKMGKDKRWQFESDVWLWRSSYASRENTNSTALHPITHARAQHPAAFPQHPSIIPDRAVLCAVCIGTLQFIRAQTIPLSLPYASDVRDGPPYLHEPSGPDDLILRKCMSVPKFCGF